MAANNSRLSAMVGTSLGLTNEAAWMRETPAAAIASISATRFSRGYWRLSN